MKQTGAPTDKVVIEMGDALVWQTLASVVIPGFVINRYAFEPLERPSIVGNFNEMQGQLMAVFVTINVRPEALLARIFDDSSKIHDTR